jgi:hypothetical protein
MSELILNGPYHQHFLNSAEFPYTDAEQTCIQNTINKLSKYQTQGSHPGMLLGKIQSGKTKTFLAIMGLAFDNGYEAAVVLTKGTKALSKQTQERIQREFKPFCDKDEVLVFDIIHMPTELVGYELKKKLIFIVKKQKDNLERLLILFSSKHPELARKKVLIIDDEADYASVGYKRQKGEIDANLTAVKLDQLRSGVSEASFLQVTATPYALYLQPENVAIKGEEFQPVKPAFTELVPVNDAYVGSDYYFDTTDDIDSVADYLYVPLSLSELTVLRKKDGRRLSLDEVLTAGAIVGLRSAFINFIVGGAIRQLQAKHDNVPGRKFSFLVHTEVAKAAHGRQEEVVEKLKTKLVTEARNSSRLFSELVEQSYCELEPSIRLEGYHLPSLDDVAERTREALVDGELLITTVNSEKEIESLLDETGQLKLRTPLNIFIGGQILDRGITIGNLIGFYYGRRPNRFQQDTVLQHSRMYGYRPKEDLAVTRFYTEPSIYDAMRRMHESDVALREAIEKNPEQKVVFIQGSASGTVMPCSPNKILLSETTTLKPHKRLLPVGFQTDCKTRTKPVTERIDVWLQGARPAGAGPEPFKIPTVLAHQIISELETVLLMEEDEGYTFDWNGIHSAIDYLAGRSPDPTKVWCLWATGRNNARLAGVGSHTRYVATPDTATTEGATARTYAKDTPMLMLFRQNGREEKGWRGSPFYWPLLWVPASTPVAIYANQTTE